MILFLLSHLFSVLLDLFSITRRSDRHKDLQILLLQQQLSILQRKHPQPPRVSRVEKLVLAVLAAKLNNTSRDARDRLCHVSLLFKPDTLLRWHRELVRRKWTFKYGRKKGRPLTKLELRVVTLRLARENPSWGYSKIHGELLKLGYDIGRSTVRDILKRERVPPSPKRTKQGSSWRAFLGHYGQQMLACDFFTVEIAWLKTLYVLFFIELGTRRVHFAGCTAHPTGEWVTQQARQISWTLRDRRDRRDEQEEQQPMRLLIRDRDTKFTAAFDRVFASEGIETVRTPYRTPQANGFAERWIRSVRTECLDRLLIVSERHLRSVMREYVNYYNRARPHQGIEQRCPIPITKRVREGPVKRRDVLGGIVHDYYRDAA